MATFLLHRVDNRLIHGQVVGIWMKQLSFNNILIVDDPLAKDPFMQRVYTSAAPKSTKLQMLSIEQTIERWNKDQFGDGSYLALYRTVEIPLELWRQGFPIDKLQIGNLDVIPGAKLLHQASRFSTAHFERIKEMSEGGVDIYCQSVPLGEPVKIKDFSV